MSQLDKLASLLTSLLVWLLIEQHLKKKDVFLPLTCVASTLSLTELSCWTWMKLYESTKWLGIWIYTVLIPLPFFLFLFLHLNILSFSTPFFRLCPLFLSFPPFSSFFPCFPALFRRWLVCFLQDISYHCSSVHSTMPLCFLPRLSLCPRPFVLRPPGSAACLSAFPRLMLLRGLKPSHLLSPVLREPAWLIKGKQTVRFPPALCKTLLIKEYKSNFMIH